jgi:hypothetical protein
MSRMGRMAVAELRHESTEPPERIDRASNRSKQSTMRRLFGYIEQRQETAAEEFARRPNAVA